MDRSLLMWIHDKLSESGDERIRQQILRLVKERLDEPVTPRITRALNVLQSECPPLAETLIIAQDCNSRLSDELEQLRP